MEWQLLCVGTTISDGEPTLPPPKSRETSQGMTSVSCVTAPSAEAATGRITHGRCSVTVALPLPRLSTAH